MAVGGKGLGAVHQRNEEIAASRANFGLRKYTPDFRWDGSKPPSENKLYLRILGDDLIISTQMHRGVPTSDKPFYGVCRRAYPIKADFCYVCDVLAKNFTGEKKDKKKEGLIPTDIAIALAVEMQEKIETKGGREVFAGYEPKMVEFEIPALTDGEKNGDVSEESKEYRKLLNGLGKPGTKVEIPHIGLMIGTINGQQALFDYAMRKTGISDRVYEISKHGEKLETKWLWDHDGSDKDMPDPAPLLASFLGKYPFELPEEWALNNGSESRYNFFFKLTPNADGAVEPADGSVGTASDDDDTEPVSNSRDRLKARLRGLGQQAE